MANNVRVAHKFFVAEGEEGEIYIFLDASKDKPENPRIVYDGKDHAVFFRAPDDKVVLDYIHPEVRDKLRHASDVVIVETILENIKDSYIASMQLVDDIPVDWSRLGLTSWENAALIKRHH